jgi:fructose-bisphosphate aldolase class I
MEPDRFERQLTKVRNAPGFIAALDQSGGSTPKALAAYGIGDDAWSSDEEMFDLMHAMRSRIIMSPAFTGNRVLGAILFEMTMDRTVDGRPTAEYLWNELSIVPFLKVDRGLEATRNGVQLMKPIDGLDELCARAVSAGVFGTKMRSVIATASRDAIDEVVAQQFEVARDICAHGLVPIIEPEVDITINDKDAAEHELCAAIDAALVSHPSNAPVMLKLSIPSTDNLYRAFIEHPVVARVVALSGGYSRDDANDRLSRQHGMIASFSRALTEGLTADQSDDEFNRVLDATISSIVAASAT